MAYPWWLNSDIDMDDCLRSFTNVANKTYPKVKVIAVCSMHSNDNTIGTFNIDTYKWPALDIIDSIKDVQHDVYNRYGCVKGFLKIIDTITVNYDIIILNQYGIAHPKRFGVASHIGFIKDKTSIGVTKDIQCGNLVNSDILMDEETVTYTDEEREVMEKLEWKAPEFHYPALVGHVINTPSGTDLYVSPGYNITVKKAVDAISYIVRTRGDILDGV